MMKNKNALLYLLAQYSYDLIALTETWLHESIITPLFLDKWSSHYDVLRCDRLEKKGGGVAFLVRKSLCPNLILNESLVNGYELLCCDITASNSSIRLIVIYRTPTCYPTLTEQMLTTISDLVSCNHSSIICGDFNMPDIIWNQHSDPTATSSTSKKFLDLCRTHGFFQHVKLHTRGSNILDLVLSNNKAMVNNLIVGPPLGTGDHFTVRFLLNFSVSKTLYVLKRNYSRANFDSIISYLSGVDWNGSFNTVTTVDEKYELFLTVLHHTIDLFVPVIKIPLGRPHFPAHLNRVALKKIWHGTVLFRVITQTTGQIIAI